MPDWWREKIRIANTGKKFPPERLEAMSRSRKGVKVPALTGDRNPMKRPEVAAKAAEAKRGIKPWNYNPNRTQAVAKQRMISTARNFLRRIVGKHNPQKRTQEIFDELGYTWLELKESIEGKFKDGMSWENRGIGSGRWQIDHIRPISSFPEGTPLSEINALGNLQPLWHKENARKGGKW